MNIDDVKKIPLDEIVERLELERHGKFIICPDPQHNDTNPTNCSIEAPNNSWKCFSCDAHGSNIDLVMRTLNVGIGDAIKWINSNTQGRPVKTRGFTPNQINEKLTVHVQNKDDILTRLIEFCGPPSKTCIDYLVDERGLTIDSINYFKITDIKSPNATAIWLFDSFGKKNLERAGLLSKNGNFLFFRHKILFPFYKKKKVHFIQARTIGFVEDTKPYLNLKTKLEYPYNCDVMKKGMSEVWITEGVIDCISVNQMGGTAVGITGIQTFKDDWIKKFESIDVVIAFDNDPTGVGETAADKLKRRFLLKGQIPKTVKPLKYKDWNKCLTEIGKIQIS